jgi:hypothetical protein
MSSQPLILVHPFGILSAAFPQFPAAIATIKNTTSPMCVHTTWPLVNVSPAMAENVMLFLCHHSINLFFIIVLF